MNRNMIIGLVLLVAVVAGLIYKFGKSDSFNWDEWDHRVSFREESKEPYSLSAIHKLARATFGSKFNELKTSKMEALASADAPNATYVFIGHQPFYDSLETARLLAFVKAGGTAFISAKQLSPQLEDSIYTYPDCVNHFEGLVNTDSENYEYDTVVTVKRAMDESDALTAEYSLYYRNKVITGHWPAIKTTAICDSVEHYGLGFYDDERMNYMSLSYGEGRFFIHTVPLVFTNFHLLREQTHPYIQSLLRDMDDDQIYWDLYAKTDEARAKAMPVRKAARSLRDSGILATMLREPALAFAWYIILGLIALFLIFRSKREQRLIPVLPTNKNSTVQFVKTISSLHFRQQNFKSLCKQDMRYFINQVRERTNLHIPMDAHGIVAYDNALIDRISLGTYYPANLIRDIFTRYEACSKYEPNADMMVDLHQSIEQFVHFKHQKRK